MRKPKPGLRLYLKTRLRHPLQMSYYLTYTDDRGNRFQEELSVHTVIVNITVAALAFVTVVRLNCTVWYFLSWIMLLFMLRYLRYLWADFSVLSENDKPDKEIERMSSWQRWFLVLEVILTAGIVTAVVLLSNVSPYARETNYLSNPVFIYKTEIGETYVHPVEFEADGLMQVYEASLDFAEDGARNAAITDYGVAVLPEGTEYYFAYKNETPSVFLKLTHEYEVCRVWTNLEYEGFLYFRYMGYDSAVADFTPIEPPTTEIDSRRIIDILCANTALNEAKAEYIYIGTHFLTDLPGLSDPGGDTWAVQVLIKGHLYYYTVSLAEGTAVLEKIRLVENEE